MEKFSTTITGYKKEEVNKFIDDVIKQVESMINNMKSKDLEIEKLKSELEHYKTLESSFNRALLVAEDAGQQIRNSARTESRALIEDARLEAERLRRNVITFKKRLRSILETQISLVDDIDRLDMDN